MELLRRFTSECAIIMNALRSPHFPNGLTPAVYSGFDFSHLSLWSLDEDALRKSLFLATPKKRRSLELRRIRRFLPFTMDKYKPRDDLVSCPNCGFLHPSGCLCVNCYNKVREETNALRSLIGDRLPSDSEVQFHYSNDPTHDSGAYPVRCVEVNRPRPSWFPAIFRRTDSDPGNNGS